ncbi:MAG TPA: hypothetical protein VF549_22025 [Solirubrobacteraceae bacterium]
MTVPPLAHAGHWLASLLYVAPVLLIVGALAWQSWRDKRRKDGPAAG